MFVILKPFEERAGNPELSADAVLDTPAATPITRTSRRRSVGVFGAPPVDGLGSTGGFKLQVQDRSGLGLEALEGGRGQRRPSRATPSPALTGLFSSFSANQPQLYVDVDRVKAKAQGVDLDDVFDTLQAYLGSAYVNDFTLFNRNWQVNVQADAHYRLAARGRRQAQGPQLPGARWCR